MSSRCAYRRPNGDFCRRWAMHGTSHCKTHQPEVQDRRADYLSKNDAWDDSTHPMLRLASHRDAFDVLRESIQAVRLGQLEPSRAYAIAFLMDRWFKARAKLAYDDRCKNLRVQMLGELADNDAADEGILDATPHVPPVITRQTATNAAAALNPPDLYDPDTGRRLVAPGIPLAPTIEELAFDVTQTLGAHRAAELYPGVTPRPFIPTGHPMPYAALQLLVGAGLPRPSSPSPLQPSTALPCATPGLPPSVKSVPSVDSPGGIIASTVNRVAPRAALKLLKRVASDLRADSNSHGKSTGPHGPSNGGPAKPARAP